MIRFVRELAEVCFFVGVMLALAVVVPPVVMAYGLYQAALSGIERVRKSRENGCGARFSHHSER